MKKVIFLLGCSLLINLTDCFSQSVKKNKNEFKSKTSTVFGYSNEFSELYLGITFGKVINAEDTTYYIKFNLSAPTSESEREIYLNKAGAINFLSKNGKLVDIKLTDAIISTENEKKLDDPHNPVKVYFISMTMILNVTKENLIEIGSEPFYNIILPYYLISSNVEDKAIFKPTLFTNRNFTQKDVKYIIDIGM